MDPMTPAAAPIRVLIVDDDPLVRSALTLMLGGRSDLELVGEASNGAEALDLVAGHRPDVVLMDLRMPVLNGLDATTRIFELADPPAVIVLTTFDADEHVVAAVAAGADGFLLKDTPPADIVDAIKRVAAGEAMLSPSVTRTLLQQVRTTQSDDRGHDRADDRAHRATERLAALTAREREVAICVARGSSNAEIARDLHLSIPTVKAHVSRLFDKLGTTNRVQIAMLVHDAGLV